MERDSTGIEAALDKIGSENSCWLWRLFILTTLPGMFNAMQMMSFVFLTTIPPFWCKIDELGEEGWTYEQIMNVSSPEGSKDGCLRYDWDYKKFASIGYNKTLDFISKIEHKPELIECTAFEYDEKTPKSTVVSEWDLVCRSNHLRSFTQVAIAFGKFFGGFVFGAISDKYGRKTSFALATLLYVTAGPLTALAPSFTVFNMTRFTIGMAGSGVYQTSFTILTEIAVRRFRTLFGCVFNISYPVGYILLPVAAYMASDWRQLQIFISLPVTILLIHFWLLPESPRWLLTKGKSEKAWKIIEKSGRINTDGRNAQQNNSAPAASQGNSERKSIIRLILHSLKEILSLYESPEVLKRIIICYIAWFSASVTYYAIALNADNFTANIYIYCALNGAVEAPGYVLSFMTLFLCGRKVVSSLFFFLTGSSLLLILLIPRDFQIAILIMALCGRFCISAVFAITILQTSELFPTVNRNSAVGTSLTMAQLGAVAAPYIVHFLGGDEYWFIPSTVCGILTICTAILVASLPETKDKPLANTVEEVENQTEKVSFLSFFKFVCFCR